MILKLWLEVIGNDTIRYIVHNFLLM